MIERRRARGERGTILVIYAMAMMGVLAMAALVLDLATLRQDRASDRAAADAAALAGVKRLSEKPEPGVHVGVSACREAWAYFLRNRPDATPVVTAPACATAFSAPCTGAVRSTTGVAGPYTVTIRHPVPDGDAMMDSERIDGNAVQAADGLIDGEPCGRMGVQVVRDRESVFGHAFGLGETTTDVHSVAVAAQSDLSKLPIALLILDPVGCGAIIANGGGSIQVRAVGSHPGYISVDTDASQCTGGNYGIDAQGSGSTIAAMPNPNGVPGVVALFGLRNAVCNTVDKACDPSDVAGGTLSPQPKTMNSRTGRVQVDWRYNCKNDYGAMNQSPCPVAPERQAYIDTLVSAVGTAGAPAGYSTYSPTYPCSIGPGSTVTVPQGNWYVNCSNVDVKGTLAFTGGNVVFDGDLKIGSSGTVTMNTANTGSLSTTCQTTVCITQSSKNHAVAYFRTGGDISRVAGGNIDFANVFVFLANGTIDLTGGNGSISWTAPGMYGTVPEGPFSNLALWSESTAAHGMSGGSGLVVDGVFFTPRCEFTYSGSGSQVQAKAQFITYRLKVTGTGTLIMAPDPDRAVEFPLSVHRLIR